MSYIHFRERVAMDNMKKDNWQMKNIMREAASDAVGISIIGNPYCYISLGTFTQSSRIIFVYTELCIQITSSFKTISEDIPYQKYRALNTSKHQTSPNNCASGGNSYALIRGMW